MMLRGEQLGERRSGGILLAVQLRAALLWADALSGSIPFTRVALITVAMVLQSVVLYSPGHFRPAAGPVFAILEPLGTATSLALCFLAVLPIDWLRRHTIGPYVAVAALGALGILSGFGVRQAVSGVSSVIAGRPYTNDGAAMDLYAAGQVLHGHNPYRKTNIVLALANINAPAITTTPLMDGQFRGARAYPSDAAIEQVFMNVLRHEPRTIPPEFESKYNYPAGSFLMILPFVWAGIHDMRFLYALALLAIGWYIAFRLPLSLRPLAPFLLMADVPLIALTAGGQPDPLYGIFLLFALAQWETKWVSPLSMGVAVATKQLAWFFLPFYLLFIWRRLGPREALRRGGLTLGVFLLLNGPFIAQSPVAYITSIAGPMSDPMFPLGIGIVALFVSNLLPMLPKIAFTLAETVSWIGGCLLFRRLRSLPPGAIVVLGAIPLFFAWRSLVNYFYLVPLLALAATLAGERVQAAPRRA